MSLVDDLRTEVGEELRAVATYEEAEWEIIYEREDISAKPRIFDKIHQELILEGMEDTFQVGRLNCTMHSFEEALCFHFVRGSMRGVFVSIEPDALLPLEAFVKVCRDSEIEASW